MSATPPLSPTRITTNPTLLSRRAVAVALVALPALWLGPRAQPESAGRATPAQSEGPFYPLIFQGQRP